MQIFNTPGTTLVIRKYIKVIGGSGTAAGPDNGIYYTNKAGEIILPDVEPGTTVIAREIRTVEGFVLDGPPEDSR